MVLPEVQSSVRELPIMVKDILKVGNPILRQQCDPVTNLNFNNELHALAEDLLDTLKSTGGYGLAAPQIGAVKRVIAVDLTAGKVRDGAKVLVNPEIIESSERSDYQAEGCLSLPGELVKISRPMKIRVKAQTVEGQEITFQAKRMMASILCHEIDHLDGVLISDHKKGRNYV